MGSTASPAPLPAEDLAAPLRAEHDALAQKLAIRRSIDALRLGLYSLLGAVLTGGLAAHHFYERLVDGNRAPQIAESVAIPAAAVAGAAFIVAVVSFLRSHRLMGREDDDFAKLRALRARLGLDR